MPADRAFVFPPFRLEPARRMLARDGEPVRIGSRAFDMLVALVERRDRTVAKDELLEIAWPGLVVEENNLQVQVLALRKLLGHPAIATIPGRGYRFTLPVEVENDGGGDGRVQPPETPGPADPPLPPSNLPLWLAPLVGRDADLAALLDALDRHAWVTLAGPAGIGKTRLAQAAAAARRGRMLGGTWWVDLAPLAEPALVPHAVALAMGLHVEGATDPVRAAATRIAGRPALLVLDNAEHLLDAVAALLGRLRPAAPELRVLVTSQEVLHAADETQFRLAPLSLPEDDTPDALQASGAAALFVARARAGDRHFAPTAANAAAIADLCRTLDGIPLAIELAAARLPLLGLDGLRTRLDQRFDLLTVGDRTASRRHRTLRRALDWSHGLLDAGEQAVFRRLGVFAGGFTLAAAQAVAADDDGIDAWEVLELLGRLVDKSLVVAEGAALPRYRMLETMRLFALERLAEHHETDTARNAHRGHFLHVAEQARAAMNRGLPAGARALDAERDNLLLAAAWTRDDPGGEVGLRLAEALHPYWAARGLFDAGLQHLRAALSHPALGAWSPLRCRVQTYVANSCLLTGRNAEGLAAAQRALARARDIDDAACTSFALASLAHLQADAGDLDEALRCANDAEHIARRLDDGLALRRALLAAAVVHDRAGRVAAALQAEEACLQLSRAAGHVRFEAEHHLNLAWQHCCQGRPEAARPHVAEVVRLVPAVDAAFFDAAVVRMAASWAAAGGWPERAVLLFAAAERCARSIGLATGLEPWETAHRQAATAATGAAALSVAAAGDGATAAQALALAIDTLHRQPDAQARGGAAQTSA